MIFSIIGTPDDIDFISDERAKHYIKSFGYRERKPFKEIFKTISAEAEDFLRRSLEFNPNKRMTITEAINHPLFSDVKEYYNKNMDIKGEPITMELENLEIEDIKNLTVKEWQFYQENKMGEWLWAWLIVIYHIPYIIYMNKLYTLLLLVALLAFVSAQDNTDLNVQSSAASSSRVGEATVVSVQDEL